MLQQKEQNEKDVVLKSQVNKFRSTKHNAVLEPGTQPCFTNRRGGEIREQKRYMVRMTLVFGVVCVT